VRQDGGVHVALALAPLLYLEWRGTEMLPSRRRLLATIAVAIGTSVAAIAVPKVFFTSRSTVARGVSRHSGHAHLSVAVLVDRARSFVAVDQVIYYPFLATLLIACSAANAGYVLGWVRRCRGSMFNFMALDGPEHVRGVAAAPFLVCMFWSPVWRPARSCEATAAPVGDRGRLRARVA